MRTRRRLALVVGQLHAGGTERQLYELAVRLDGARYDPFVVCLSEVTDPFAARLEARGIDVAALPRAGHRDPARVRSLARLLGARRADLAHSFLLAANAYTYAATRLGARCPFIASSRVCSPDPGAWSRWLHRRAFRGAAAVVANSRRVKEYTCALYGVPEARVRVIPNGIALEGYRPVAEVDRRRVRGELGAGGDAFLVGSLGRLAPQKNLDLFLSMAARLAGAPGLGDRLRFALVGDGPARDHLLDVAARLGLADRVRFAGVRHDVARVLSALDVFVLTSEYEGLPNAVMEAMAAGLPVVATRVGGTEEVVIEAQTGHLVRRGDAEALADRVARLAADPEQRHRMGRRARARIAAEFSVETMVARTVALYDEVLG